MAKTGEEIKAAVWEHYGERARNVSSSCCGSGNAPDGRKVLYQVDDVADLPDSVPSYGCGNPTAIAGMKAGEVVLDLGSGPGLDCFLSAKQVGESGRVIGLDMTQDMLDLANANRDKLGMKNVEFRKGEMEAMPIDSSSIDVIISNCVINLSPEKDAVFAEAFRVLKPRSGAIWRRGPAARRARCSSRTTWRACRRPVSASRASTAARRTPTRRGTARRSLRTRQRRSAAAVNVAGVKP